MHAAVHLDHDLGVQAQIGQDLCLTVGLHGLNDVILGAVVQQLVGADAQNQNLAVLMGAAQLHGFVQAGHSKVTDAVLHHIAHHSGSTVTVSVSLDDGHGLNVRADLSLQAIDVVLQFVQIDLAAGCTQHFHIMNTPVLQNFLPLDILL